MVDPTPISQSHPRRPLGFQTGSGDGGMMDNNERLVVLETHFGYIQRDLGDIKASLKHLTDLPTKRDLDSWKWQWIGLSLAVIVLAVTGIVGGLALINHSVDDKTPAPIVFQVPTATPATVPAPAGR